MSCPHAKRPGTHSISYTLSLSIAGELGGLAPRSGGSGSKDLVDGDGHCGFFPNALCEPEVEVMEAEIARV